ncbi:pentatricopeptide repeat-containing protein At5g04780, mitochondrial-like [Selaginella moellendorffii]|uniref:pentatricopeptide repeat-containing protein At5g04780, mitochondrial-like n=1 Tax=Selaginella moellendorffii TaxID=88036 RepID=UPI000D1C8319|nr:pentatricopeptide repeat-containing protein At5g04780, mitochondrial-like [Selaginella moellendorffii]|eukprot:XP_024537183.1 pentatricopeptide repeat-containing protein At5g04780, mitochondrial-like [Selaginella moellendorffii]
MQTGFDTDLTLQNTLLSMYGKCGMLDKLHDMFYIIEAPDAVSYNSIISALGHNSQPRQALFFFRCMLLDGNLLSLITFISVAHACGCIGDPRPAVALCSLIRECSGVTTSDSVLRSAIVAMHGRCGDVEAAREAYESYAKDELNCTSMARAAVLGKLEIDRSQDLAYIPGVQMVMRRAASAKEDIDAFSDANEWECFEDGDDKPYVCKLENVLAHPLDGVCDQQFFNKAALNQCRIRIHNREIDLENQVQNEVLPRRLENQKLKLLNMKYSHIKDEESQKIKILQEKEEMRTKEREQKKKKTEPLALVIAQQEHEERELETLHEHEERERETLVEGESQEQQERTRMDGNADKEKEKDKDEAMGDKADDQVDLKPNEKLKTNC